MHLLNRFVDRIEHAQALDRIADTLAKVSAPIAQRPVVRDALTGRWLGHSVHPMLVALPIGCWTGSMFLDAASPGSDAARRLTGVGVLGAIAAGAAGTADWLDTSAAERRVGTAHALFNDVAVAAFALSWLARRRGATWLGAGLSGVGLGAVAVAGHLGGHLAYVRGVGINTTAFQSGPTEWQDLGRSGDLEPETPAAAVVDGMHLLAIRRDDAVHVLEDRCTHRGAPLSDGTIVDGCIECPWHHSRFDLDDGSVRQGPASVPQPVYESRIADGRVQIRRTELGSLRANPVGASRSRPD